jgi:hypothetical protein
VPEHRHALDHHDGGPAGVLHHGPGDYGHRDALRYAGADGHTHSYGDLVCGPAEHDA